MSAVNASDKKGPVPKGVVLSLPPDPYSRPSPIQSRHEIRDNLSFPGQRDDPRVLDPPAL